VRWSEPVNSTLNAAQSSNDLLVRTDGPVLHITINRPQARNALTLGMYERLGNTLSGLTEAYPEVRVVLISGAGGKAFASGTDISEFDRFRSADDAIAYERGISRILGLLETCAVPTVAAIAGACTGGGLAIAACCDVRMAAANARFGVPIARTLGNCLSLSSHHRLVRLIGAGRVMDMILTARLLDANEALMAGLVSQLVTDSTELLAKSEEAARSIAANAPITMRVTRESLASLAVPVDQELEDRLMLKAYMSADFAEGVAAFLERRPPVWQGR
jgi:enoyl-CoA hydratase/carnithine racemase